MSSDSDGFSLDCTSDDPFDPCSLGPEAGESRAAWLARLKRRFACQPIPPLPLPLPLPLPAFVRREDRIS